VDYDVLTTLSKDIGKDMCLNESFKVSLLLFFIDVPELLVLETIQKTKRISIYLIQCSAVWSQESETVYQISRTIMLYVLPLLLMSVTYYQIVRVLWKSDNIPGHTETVQMFNSNAYNGKFFRIT